MDEATFRNEVEKYLLNPHRTGGKSFFRIYALERQVRLLQLSIAALAVALLIHLIK